MSELKSFLRGRTPVTFIDLFAGAGGISEGFLQADANKKYFDFLLASDINENCELTHRVRFNKQLGLDTKFITEDIMSPSFLPDLLKELGGRQVDVVTGGPSCQSFSLAGRRKRFDKRDNLFDHYLKVIRALRPKYFVMENVKGILTKDKGHFKEEIMREMRSIIDDNVTSEFTVYLNRMLYNVTTKFMGDAICYKFLMELEVDDKKASGYKDSFFENLEGKFKSLTRRMDYRVSKSDHDVNTIRHGLLLLKHSEARSAIIASVINEKTAANIDNDEFSEPVNSFMSAISDEAIIGKINSSIDAIGNNGGLDEEEIAQLKHAVAIYAYTLDECFNDIRELAVKDNTADELDDIISRLRLYNVNQMILVSSDYGVPQNRERVVYIGSRNDQKEIKGIPPTVRRDERVTVYEALEDLDFIDNGQTAEEYQKVQENPLMGNLIRKRDIDGHANERSGKTYAQWSRIGRQGKRFKFECRPFYVRNLADLGNPQRWQHMELFNHQTSLQNERVRSRLRIIAKYGGYTDECKAELKAKGLESAKRNYFVLVPESQSPTVCTMPDDFIHYSAMRPMTVREMARLQSFDDSFVFQGKRQTGGNKRKSEIPQYTLVGNAVPPLMAKAIGNEILKNIT